MIRPSQQWALMIDITNACHLHCSNCTRLLDHAKPRYFMSPECFRAALSSIKDFPRASEPVPPRPGEKRVRRKVIGIIGGEPLLHPELPAIADIFCELVPEVYYRGFWTAKDWRTGSHPKWGPYRPIVEKIIGKRPTHDVSGPSRKHDSGFLNWNMHLPEMDVHHQPLLVAIKDVIPDERERWELIQTCWVQREWSGTCTDKGFFFCEVAGHFDRVFGGPGGLPFEPDVWRGELTFVPDENGVPRPQGKFADQIRRACENCGACLRLAGRLDSANRDDVSPSNLAELERIGSPRLKRGEVEVYDIGVPYQEREVRDDWQPMDYVKGQKMW
ncbi:MAG: hypothetical protein AB7E98_11930 [Pirellulales bacterium]